MPSATALRRTVAGVSVPLLSVALISGPASAATPTAPVPKTIASSIAQVVAAGVPGVIVRVDGDGPPQTASAGTSNLATGTALTPGARFRIGSLTKSYVATVVLQLVGEKRIILDAPVERYLPGALTLGKQITVRQLLNHTSGVPDYTLNPSFLPAVTAGTVFSPRQLLALANAMPRAGTAGSGFDYSNTNYIATGLLVEKVTRHPLATVLDHRIFRPLHLRHTSFATVTPANIAHGYVPADWNPAHDGTPYDLTALNASHAWAAGAIVSNAADVSTFYRALFGGRLLAPAQLRAMKTTVAQDPSDPRSKFRYGLGIERIRDACGANWGHGGAIFGYSTAAYWNERTGRTFVLATTMMPAPPAADAPMSALVDALVC
jgi:D-alanyl-D-alanine carboxypeptidase